MPIKDKATGRFLPQSTKVKFEAKIIVATIEKVLSRATWGG